MFKNLKTGLVYRNPIPHVFSIHAYFPSVVLMKNGEMLATFVLGEAFEAANCHTNIARSKDLGETWQLEGPIYSGTKKRLTSDSARITALPDGEIVVFMSRADRTEHPNEGLANPKNMGFVPHDSLILRSNDYGKTWTTPKVFTPPLKDSIFEICCPITPLKDKRWILPTSTWANWDGYFPNGKRMVAFVSHDRGKSWTKYWNVMVDAKQNTYYWESKIIELMDGRLLAIAWTFDSSKNKDLPDQYALSEDSGKTWTKPKSTGLQGQTMTPFLLDNGYILSVYRRTDQPGLWANISHFKGDKWINDDCKPLWGHQYSGLTGKNKNMVKNFNVLRFGAPCICKLPDKSIYVAFWCYEDCVSNIRWLKFKIN